MSDGQFGFLMGFIVGAFGVIMLAFIVSIDEYVVSKKQLIRKEVATYNENGIFVIKDEYKNIFQ